MKTGIILVLIVFIGGCRTTSKVITNHIVSENNKDVFILSTLIQDYLRNTNKRDLNLNELIGRDTLRRITNNFEKIELINRGGHIAVKFKFSNSRDKNKIELNAKETEIINNLRWIIKESKEQYDGEIQFDYGERFYRRRKIILKKGSSVANTSQRDNWAASAQG